jgi:hypothetical protein
MSQSIDDSLGRHFQDFINQQNLLQGHRIEEQYLKNSNSLGDILKLYQTRDCLGRLVCEW